jgi:TorA maturation chaperone TorD
LYRAFGFDVGGAVHERPDHLATELEFMYALALKEIYAATHHMTEAIEICVDAQRKFLRDHLAAWIGFFAKRLALNEPAGVYHTLADFAGAFVRADVERLAVEIPAPSVPQISATPLGPELSCGDCVLSEQ